MTHPTDLYGVPKADVKEAFVQPNHVNLQGVREKA